MRGDLAESMPVFPLFARLVAEIPRLPIVGKRALLVEHHVGIVPHGSGKPFVEARGKHRPLAAVGKPRDAHSLRIDRRQLGQGVVQICCHIGVVRERLQLGVLLVGIISVRIAAERQGDEPSIGQLPGKIIYACPPRDRPPSPTARRKTRRSRPGNGPRPLRHEQIGVVGSAIGRHLHANPLLRVVVVRFACKYSIVGFATSGGQGPISLVPIPQNFAPPQRPIAGGFHQPAIVEPQRRTVFSQVAGKFRRRMKIRRQLLPQCLPLIAAVRGLGADSAPPYTPGEPRSKFPSASNAFCLSPSVFRLPLAARRSDPRDGFHLLPLLHLVGNATCAVCHEVSLRPSQKIPRRKSIVRPSNEDVSRRFTSMPIPWDSPIQSLPSATA